MNELKPDYVYEPGIGEEFQYTAEMIQQLFEQYPQWSVISFEVNWMWFNVERVGEEIKMLPNRNNQQQSSKQEDLIYADTVKYFDKCFRKSRKETKKSKNKGVENSATTEQGENYIYDVPQGNTPEKTVKAVKALFAQYSQLGLISFQVKGMWFHVNRAFEMVPSRTSEGRIMVEEPIQRRLSAKFAEIFKKE